MLMLIMEALQQFMPLFALLQSADPTGMALAVLERGGLLGGALLVIYGQHKFYRFMLEKIEEKHVAQVAWLEGELERLSTAFLEKSRKDTDTISDLARSRRE
jgi:hypothetical protein